MYGNYSNENLFVVSLKKNVIEIIANYFILIRPKNEFL